MSNITTKGFEFWYPANNRVGIPIELVPGVLLVDEVKEQRLIPLAEFLANPMTRYGYTLVSGIDPANNERRTIYLEAAAGRRLPRMRFVLIDPSDPDDKPEPVSRKFKSCFANQQRIVDIAATVEVPGHLALAIELVD